MDLALMIARSGLDAQHKTIEVISNNLANANTTSFKRNRPEFVDLPYQVVKLPGSPLTETTNTTNGLVIGTGTKLAANKKIFIEGPQIQTGNEKNLYIKGRGFFQVQPPGNGGTDYAYTRDGSLTINDQGQLTLTNGYVLQPTITIPQGTQSMSVSQDGIVTVMVNGQQTAQQIGQLQIADFLNYDGLQPVGDNLYLQTEASGEVILGNPNTESFGQVLQGVLEGSNVSIVEEMVNLIEAQRAFEVTSKTVSAVDNMLDQLSQVT